MSSDAALARRLIGQFELQCLDGVALEDDLERLIRKAVTPFGSVAALCVWPNFISIAASRLAGKGVRVATVINYPKGGDDVERAIGDAEEAIDDGAEEIDLVFPASSFLDGDEPIARSMIAEVKDVLPEDAALKVILTGAAFADLADLRRAAAVAIEEGADFLKLSAGQTAAINSAQTEAVLSAIHAAGKSCGFVSEGAFATWPALHAGFDAAARIIGEPWASVERFRVSSGGGLEVLIAIAEGKTP